jgi:hypothetical protein
MAFLRPGFLVALILSFVSPGFAAQAGTPQDIFTIVVAAPTAAKDVQVRYFFTGEFGGYGSSTSDPIDGNKIVIKTGVEGKSAKTFKAIVYAPGCQFVTITVDDLTPSNRQGDFTCQKLPTIQLHGRIDTSNLGQGTIDTLNLGQKEWQVEAVYVCSWAMPFFGIADGSTSPLALGKAPVAADGSFTIELPDFTADPTWPSISKQAALMFFLRDPGADTRVAALVAPAGLSRTGNLQVATSYPEVPFEIFVHP